MCLCPYDNVLTSQLDFVQNEPGIHCTEDGGKINMDIEVRNIILDFLKASREDKCTDK